MSLAREIATGVLLVFLLVAGNVVAVGVSRVLGEITLAAGPEVSSQPWPWLVITAAAIGATVMFLQGAIPAGMQLLKRIG